MTPRTRMGRVIRGCPQGLGTGKYLEKGVFEFADNMTAAKASTKRGMRIESKLPSPKEKRAAKEALQKPSNKWTIDRLWLEYEKQKEDSKSFRTFKGLYENYLKDHSAPEDLEYYICGPPLMLAAINDLLLGDELKEIRTGGRYMDLVK